MEWILLYIPLFIIVVFLGMIGNRLDRSLDKIEGYLDQIVQMLKQ